MPTLTVLHTNDIHARLDQMTRLMTLIQRERASASAEGRATLLLDAGDSSSTEEWESDVTGGRANYA
ncbi:MAG: bifunctional metallophosphatase/5'-nucleotidase, partial [Chloroflexota bacterium]